MDDDLNDIRQDLANLSGLPAAILRIESKLNDVDDIVRILQIEGAKKESEQDTLIIGLQKSVNGVGVKISHHISSHWTFLLAMVGLVGAIVLVAGLLAK